MFKPNPSSIALPANSLMILVAFVSAAWNPGSQAATYIVDTGTPVSASPGYDLGDTYDQALAAQFFLNSDYTLSGIEGYMSGVLNETGTIAVYSDNGNTPGTEVFSSAFVGSSNDAAWQGIDNISWLLTAGTYWVAFEERAGQSLSGGMLKSAPSPLGIEATKNTFSPQQSGWVVGNGLDFGVRIAADIPSVPIPAAVWLFGSGLIGLISLARRKRM